MIKGIDLSTWQKNVNYQELKNNGIEFAILRTGYGKDKGQKDEMFEKHYEGCKNVGIKVGAYLYSYCAAIENAGKEAYNCLEHINNKSFDLPIFIDIEEKRTLNLGRDAVTEIAKRFCRVIESKGYNAGVYANLNDFNNYIKVEEIQNEGYFIWLAQYYNKITANFVVDIWQYTNNYDNKHLDGNYLINESILKKENINTSSDIKSLAVDVILGKYGNGQERKNLLGTKYNEVQNLVNKIFTIIKER